MAEHIDLAEYEKRLRAAYDHIVGDPTDQFMLLQQRGMEVSIAMALWEARERIRGTDAGDFLDALAAVVASHLLNLSDDSAPMDVMERFGLHLASYFMNGIEGGSATRRVDIPISEGGHG